MPVCLGGFTSGAPCSERNTVIPPFRHPAEVQCLDITRLVPTKWLYVAFDRMPHRTNVTTLYADGMQLQVVPLRVLQALPNLTLIDLSQNAITKFQTNSFHYLHHLDVLLLSNNQIIMPKKRNLLDSTSLTTLKLSNNGINRVFPFTFHNLYSLKALYLDGNKLKRVPYLALKPLHMLKYLDLSNNQIVRLPSNDKLPPKLVKFMVQGNLGMIRAPRSVAETKLGVQGSNGTTQEIALWSSNFVRK